MRIQNNSHLMRIGIDCRLWGETGVGRYIRNLVENLQKIDKKNQYFLFVLKKDYEEIRSSITNNQWSIVSADIRWHSIKEQLKFPRILDKENLDLVHFPYFSVPIFYRKPFVVTIHDLIINNFPTGKASTLPLPFYYLKRKGYSIVLKKSLINAKKIITVSNTVSNELQTAFGVPKEKISVAYEGIDPIINDKGLTINKKTSYSQPNTNYFLYVGNVYPHKNIERLIKAFRLVCYDSPNVEIIFVGKNDYFYNKLRYKVSKLDISKNIIFKHNIDDTELSGLYQNAIALVTPSLMEGFGLPAIEAMASKCLVLASDIPVYKEILKDNAIYFDPTNFKSISESIMSIMKFSESEKNKRVAKAYEYSKNFSWEKMARETLKIYENCVSL